MESYMPLYKRTDTLPRYWPAKQPIRREMQEWARAFDDWYLGTYRSGTTVRYGSGERRITPYDGARGPLHSEVGPTPTITNEGCDSSL